MRQSDPSVWWVVTVPQTLPMNIHFEDRRIEQCYFDRWSVRIVSFRPVAWCVSFVFSILKSTISIRVVQKKNTIIQIISARYFKWEIKWMPGIPLQQWSQSHSFDWEFLSYLCADKSLKVELVCYKCFKNWVCLLPWHRWFNLNKWIIILNTHPLTRKKKMHRSAFEYL